jgi:hypothetical protein
MKAEAILMAAARADFMASGTAYPSLGPDDFIPARMGPKLLGSVLLGIAAKDALKTRTGKAIVGEGIEITGFTKHGINRVVGDGAKRAGVKPEALLDALKNPTKIKSGVDSQGRPYQIFEGKNARVVVNPETGNIISANPLTGIGAH